MTKIRFSFKKKVTSIITYILLACGSNHLYPFCVEEYPKNMLLDALGSNFRQL